jgi:hypothetical protein
MQFRDDWPDDEFELWLDHQPSADVLRDAYLLLESWRADLWASSDPYASFHDRCDLDSLYVDRLVRIKRVLFNRGEAVDDPDAADRSLEVVIELNVAALGQHLARSMSAPPRRSLPQRLLGSSHLR